MPCFHQFSAKELLVRFWEYFSEIGQLFGAANQSGVVYGHNVAPRLQPLPADDRIKKQTGLGLEGAAADQEGKHFEGEEVNGFLCSSGLKRLALGTEVRL